MDNRYEIAEQNGMSREFADWFFDNKKAGCGNIWFMMMAAMWLGWQGRAAMLDNCATVESRNHAGCSPKNGLKCAAMLQAGDGGTNSKLLTITLPALPVLGSREEWYQGFAAGAGSMREECAAALISAGIDVEVK